MIQKIKSFAKDFVNGDAKPEYEAEIKRVYFQMFGQRLSGCRTCMVEALFKILNHKPMGKFRVKRGVQFNEHSDITKRLNWKTQNDELCEYWLKKDPNNARFFDEIPEGYIASITKEAKEEAKIEVEKPEINTIIEHNVTEITESGQAKPKKYHKRK